MRIFTLIIIIATLAACEAKMSLEEAQAKEREAVRLAAKAALQLQHQISARFDICLRQTEAQGMSQSSAVIYCSQRECMRYRRAAEQLQYEKAYARRLPANNKSGMISIGEALNAMGADISIREKQTELENSMMAYGEYCKTAGLRMY